MTKKILFTSSFVSLIALAALAQEHPPLPVPPVKQGFNCYVPVSSKDPSYAQVSVVNNDQNMASVVLAKGGSMVQLTGSFETFSTRIGSQIAYKLADIFGHEANLTISKSFFIGRGGCGRGSCDGMSSGTKTIKTALLTFGNQQIRFNCQEVAVVGKDYVAP
jgi:hypothetical protein